MAKLSLAMLGMLRNISEGKSPTYGLNGRSAHGGATWTLVALRRRGLIATTPLYGSVVTDAGREVLKEDIESRSTK